MKRPIRPSPYSTRLYSHLNFPYSPQVPKTLVFRKYLCQLLISHFKSKTNKNFQFFGKFTFL